MIIPLGSSRKVECFELNGDRLLTFVFITERLSEPLQRVNEFGSSGLAKSPEPFDCRTTDAVGLFQIALAIEHDAES